MRRVRLPYRNWDWFFHLAQYSILLWLKLIPNKCLLKLFKCNKISYFIVLRFPHHKANHLQNLIPGIYENISNSEMLCFCGCVITNIQEIFRQINKEDPTHFETPVHILIVQFNNSLKYKCYAMEKSLVEWTCLPSGKHILKNYCNGRNLANIYVGK